MHVSKRPLSGLYTGNAGFDHNISVYNYQTLLLSHHPDDRPCSEINVHRRLSLSIIDFDRFFDAKISL